MRFKLKIVRYWLQILLAPKLKSRDEIEKLQAKRLKDFVQKTLSQSVFYRAFNTNNDFDWDAVPQISKKEFMDSFNEINTQDIDLEHAWPSRQNKLGVLKAKLTA